MVAVFTKVGTTHVFGGSFENLQESLGYLKYLEHKNTEFYVQIGWMGRGMDDTYWYQPFTDTEVR